MPAIIAVWKDLIGSVPSEDLEITTQQKAPDHRLLRKNIIKVGAYDTTIKNNIKRFKTSDMEKG